MPYIATDLDAFDSAQGVAGATALPLQHVLGGLALLWRWCWRQKTDAVTGDQLAAHFGSAAPGLAPALVAFGFLEARGNAYRVRGAARYLHIAAVRSAAGKKRAAGAKRGARGQLLTSTSPAHAGELASTSPAAGQHVTSPSATSDERRATSDQEEDLRTPSAPRSLGELVPECREVADTLAAARVHQPAPQKKKRPAPTGPPDGADATYRAIVDACYVLFREDRGYDMDPGGKDWAALKRLRAKHEGAEIIRRFGHGVRARYKAKCSGWMDLEAKWNDCGAPEASQGLPARRTGPDPNQGIVRHQELTPEEVEEVHRKQEEWLNG